MLEEDQQTRREIDRVVTTVVRPAIHGERVPLAVSAHHVHGEPVIDQTAIACQSIEAIPERGAGPEGVLDQVQRAARHPLGHVETQRLVGGRCHRQAPRLE